MPDAFELDDSFPSTIPPTTFFLISGVEPQTRSKNLHMSFGNTHDTSFTAATEIP